MPKFVVYYRITEEGQIEVEADSKEAARIQVEELSPSEVQRTGQTDYDCLEVVDLEAVEEG